MRDSKALLLDQLDRKLLPYKALGKVSVPNRGWIYTIRKGLNMSLRQLGVRMGMSRQGVKKLEEREASGSITLRSLQEVGAALDLRFVYGFAPVQSSLEEMVESRARDLATEIVLRTHQNMQLENQGNDQERIRKAISDLAAEIKRGMAKSLWE